MGAGFFVHFVEAVDKIGSCFFFSVKLGLSVQNSIFAHQFHDVGASKSVASATCEIGHFRAVLWLDTVGNRPCFVVGKYVKVDSGWCEL